MADPDAPTIDPTFFDLVIFGTGLPQSLVAAAAAACGKSVLHLDSNHNYLSHFGSLSPPALASFLQQNASPAAAAAAVPPPDSPTPESSDCVAVAPEPRPVYSEVVISGQAPEPSREFFLDVSGPRVLYCADPTVDVIVRSSARHYVSFKGVDASLLYWDGKLQAVPDSRAAIFKDKSLGLTEKSQLMRFLKLVRQHIESDGGEGKEGGKVAEEDLEIPFVEFLEKQKLPPKIKKIVLYAIAMADFDQESPESCENLMKTKEGLASLSLYSVSIGRFPNAVGPFIYPMYGHGELPQAFCRSAAVKGALYVLRMPISSLLLKKVLEVVPHHSASLTVGQQLNYHIQEDKEYKGVKLANGQDIFSHQLLMDSSLAVPLPLSACIRDGGYDSENAMEARHGSHMAAKVARLVCLTKSSLHPELSNILIVFPPGSLFPGQKTSIRALQLGSSSKVCPTGFFVVYLSAKCNDAVQGKDHLLAAMNTFFKPPCEDGDDGGGTNNRGEDSENSNESADEPKPRILWSALYVQELKQVTVGTLSSSPMPDGNLDYGSLLDSTKKIFQNMYPQEEFFPATLTPNDDEDDSPQD